MGKKDKNGLSWAERQLAKILTKAIYKRIKPYIEMKSWKTTLGGAVMALGAFFQTVQDPSWMQLVGTVLIGLGGMIMGVSARDNGVTSKQAGAE